LKKRAGRLWQRGALNSACIADHQPSWPVLVRCAGFGGGRSGLYDALPRQAAPARRPEEVVWLARLTARAEKTPHREGRRRLSHQLQDAGDDVGRFTGRRVMQPAGGAVAGCRRRAPKTTESRPGDGVAPHGLARHGDVTAPQVAWCGDRTSRWTEAGGWSVSGRWDVSARKVGGAMRARVETPWVPAAFARALGRRWPPPGLVHHRARGAQYARHASRALRADHGMPCRMRGKGDGLDTAVAERCFGRGQRERPSKRSYRTRPEARDDVLEYLERFSNRGRPQASLGYGSPQAYEKIAQAASFCVRFHLTTTYDILHDEVAYHDLGSDHFDRLRRERTGSHVMRRLQRWGYHGALEATAPEAA
jgi:putative transposase